MSPELVSQKSPVPNMSKLASPEIRKQTSEIISPRAYKSPSEASYAMPTGESSYAMPPGLKAQPRERKLSQQVPVVMPTNANLGAAGVQFGSFNQEAKQSFSYF
jgi:hypothetical protein